MTKEEAYRLAVKKWTMLSEGVPLDEVKKDDELSRMRYGCSYCELFADIYCEGCPLNIDNIACPDIGHVYDTWYHNKTKKNAKKVLDLIIETKDKLNG